MYIYVHAQVIELVKALFELEVKVENLDDVSDRWALLHKFTGKLHR
jgi:hypothetical protein